MHWLLGLGTALLVIVSCLLAGAAWRLAQGPINLGPWSDRVRAALVDDASPVRVSFNGLFLEWEGFHEGVDHPLDLRLSNLTIADPAGRRLISAPDAHLTFSLAGLLFGRVVPRAIEVDRAKIAVSREIGGAIDLGSDLRGGNSASLDLKQLGEQLSRPASTDHGRSRGLFDQIRRAHFRNTEVTFLDKQSGLTALTSDMDVDLVRAANGHLRGLIRAPLSVGDQKTGLRAEANWASDSGVRLDVSLTAIRPAGLAPLPLDLSFLEKVDVPVLLTGAVSFDRHFKPYSANADLLVGQGRIHLGQGSIPVRSGTIVVSAGPNEVTIERCHLDLAHTPEGAPELVDLKGTIAHAADRLSASLTLGLGPVDIADLPRLWPKGIADGARGWVIGNVMAGMTTPGNASLVIEADDSLRNIVLTKAVADLGGSNGTFTWIDNMPPVEQTDFELHLLDPDTLDIHLTSGHQRVRTGGPDVLIGDSQMRITGLSLPDQAAVIRTKVAGSVASVLSLLKEPRLHLLSAHPIAIKTGGGEVSAIMDFRFPLNNNLEIDDVDIHADAHVTKLRLLDVAAGQGIDDGIFDLGIDKTGLSLKGQGSVAAVPVTVNGSMSFNPGPPEQIVQKFAMTGQPDAKKLDAAGLHVTDLLDGPVPLTVAVIERRNGEGSVSISGDLTLATLTVGPLAWSKSSGTTASASATLLMAHDRLTKIDKIVASSDGMLLSGSADLADGHVRTVQLDTLRLGQTQGRGAIHLEANKPLAVVLQGDQIDLVPKLTAKAPAGANQEAPPATAPSWTLDARFKTALLANGERAADMLVKAAGEGETIRLLDAVGASYASSSQASSGFSIKIGPRNGTRHLLVDAKDAGGFLRGVDAVRVIRSGHLTVDGVLAKPSGLYPLVGTATIDNVIVGNSPFLGKLLQAITLYGLVDVLRGPGMQFSHVIMPFHYDGANLGVDNAHAYNPSLGLTMNGRVSLASGHTAMTGTIVPAYFFNSMLGRLPLVGKLFSPETGGGVFAARFAINGQIDDPTISINPVSALTPGFLRGIFDRAPSGNDNLQSEAK